MINVCVGGAAIVLGQGVTSLGEAGHLVPKKLVIDLGHCSIVSVQGVRLRSNMDRL